MSAPTPLLPSHPLRLSLNDEAHARPPAAILSPARLSTLALLCEPGAPGQRAALARLAAELGLPAPEAHAGHYQGSNDTLTLRWSLHTEFVRLTVIVPGAGSGSFDDTALDAVPAALLSALPGEVLVAAHALLLADDEALPAAPRAIAARWFAGHELIGAELGDGNGIAYTDLRLHPDARLAVGFSRFVLVDRKMGPRQSGRMLQRLFEIETYRMLALLALPLAKQQMARLDELGIALKAVTARLNAADSRDDTLLEEFSALSAELENLVAQTQYRFSASHAYYQLIERRIGELRERRIGGLQPFCEFVEHRLAPAMDTCLTVTRRQDRLTARLQRATALLRTRVEVEGEVQNRALLASMDRRAELQLRLQETVEGLSVGVLTYYAVGLVGYAAKAAKAAGLHLNAELVTGAAIAPVALAVWWGMRQVRRRLGHA